MVFRLERLESRRSVLEHVARTLSERLTDRQSTAPAVPQLLVVDGDPGIRAFLMRSLALVECVPIVATNGPEALKLFDTTPIDLLLSDLMMPGMNGLELGRRLRRRTGSQRSAILTGHSDALFEEAALLGANEAFVDKPISSAGLHQAISLCALVTSPAWSGGEASKPATAAQNTAWV